MKAALAFLALATRIAQRLQIKPEWTDNLIGLTRSTAISNGLYRTTATRLIGDSMGLTEGTGTHEPKVVTASSYNVFATSNFVQLLMRERTVLRFFGYPLDQMILLVNLRYR